MRRGALSKAASNCVTSIAPPSSIWITDAVLADAYHRFAHRASGCKRHGSHVPGPMEALRRQAKRRHTFMMSQLPSAEPMSWFQSFKWLFQKEEERRTEMRYEAPTWRRPRNEQDENYDWGRPPETSGPELKLDLRRLFPKWENPIKEARTYDLTDEAWTSHDASNTVTAAAQATAIMDDSRSSAKTSLQGVDTAANGQMGDKISAQEVFVEKIVKEGANAAIAETPATRHPLDDWLLRNDPEFKAAILAHEALQRGTKAFFEVAALELGLPNLWALQSFRRGPNYSQFIEAFKAIGPRNTAVWLGRHLKHGTVKSHLELQAKALGFIRFLRSKIWPKTIIASSAATEPFVQLYAAFDVCRDTKMSGNTLCLLLSVLHDCWGVAAVQAFYCNVRVHTGFTRHMKYRHDRTMDLIRKCIMQAAEEGRMHDVALLVHMRIRGVHVLDTPSAILQLMESDNSFKPDVLRMLDRRSTLYDAPVKGRADPSVRMTRLHLDFVENLAQAYAWSNDAGGRTYGRLQACYLWLKRHRLPITPKFVQALVQGAVVKPLEQWDYVPTTRLRRILGIVQRIHDQQAAIRLEDMAWATRQDIFKVVNKRWRMFDMAGTPKIKLARRFGLVPVLRPRYTIMEMSKQIEEYEQMMQEEMERGREYRQRWRQKNKQAPRKRLHSKMIKLAAADRLEAAALCGQQRERDDNERMAQDVLTEGTSDALSRLEAASRRPRRGPRGRAETRSAIFSTGPNDQ